MGEPEPTDPRRSKQNAALQRLRIANLALWIAHPTSLGFRFVIHQERDNNSYRWRGYETFLYPIPLERYARNSIERATLKRARRIFLAIDDLPKNSTVWSASRTLFKALTESDPSLRFPMLWIAIEALLGAGDGREIRFRLSQRAALFLGSDRPDAIKIFKEVNRAYDSRSKVVHGMRVSEGINWEEIVLSAEGILRGILLKVLARRPFIQTFNSKKRDEFLDSLAFKGTRARRS